MLRWLQWPSSAPSVAPETYALTTTFAVTLHKDKAGRIGILVRGNDVDAPEITKVEADSDASRSRPRLKVGYKVLAINGKRMVGAATVSKAITEAIGELVLEVEGEPPDAIPECRKQWREVERTAQQRRQSSATHRIGEHLPPSPDKSKARQAKAALIIDGTSAGMAPAAGDADSAVAQAPILRPIASTFTVHVTSEDGSSSLGLMLAGHSNEPPLIFQVGSALASSEPQFDLTCLDST